MLTGKQESGSAGLSAMSLSLCTFIPHWLNADSCESIEGGKRKLTVSFGQKRFSLLTTLIFVGMESHLA